MTDSDAIVMFMIMGEYHINKSWEQNTKYEKLPSVICGTKSNRTFISTIRIETGLNANNHEFCFQNDAR